MYIHSGTMTSQLPLLAHTGIKHEAPETILTVWCTHWVFLAIITFNDWISIMGFIIIMRI